jgi:hypothetical protein
MKKIKLTQGKYAIVDGWNYDWLNQWKWCADEHRNTYYAKRKDYTAGKRQIIYMHRLILGLKPGDGKHTDHINHDGLDNCQYNLRIVTNRENSNNRTNPTKGCYWHKQNKKWTVRIWFNNKNLYLGSFTNQKDAQQAYVRAKKQILEGGG